MLRANYGGLPLQRAPIEPVLPTDPSAASYEQLRTDMAANREHRQGLPMRHASLRGGPANAANTYEATQPASSGKEATSTKGGVYATTPTAPACPPGFTLTEFGCATQPVQDAAWGSVAKCPPGTVQSGALCYYQAPPATGAAFMPPSLPTPPTPGTLIDQNQPGLQVCWNGMQVPVGAACPPIVPQSGGELLAFWNKHKKLIFIGGGLLGGISLLTLIFGATRRRRGSEVPSL
jgi:hypothetical protein